MREEIISFETAKLAKEKGFDVKSANKYDDEGRIIEPILQVSYKIYYPFCSQSLLQKWLREKHNIDVWSQPFVYRNSLPDEYYSYHLYKDGVFQKDGVNFLDFEEALERGLKEALKLIQ